MPVKAFAVFVFMHRTNDRGTEKEAIPKGMASFDDYVGRVNL